MKFEEVLPLMKQGQIAVWGCGRYREAEGKLIVQYDIEWTVVFLDWAALSSEEWQIEKVKVKKWQWVFGRGHGLNIATSIYHTEESAEKNRIQRGYEWKHPIPQTEIEVEED